MGSAAGKDLADVQRALIKLACDEGSAKWAKKHSEIKEEGNKKRSEAAKGNDNAVKNKPKTVVDHSEQLLNLPDKKKTAVAREARAAEAHVSSSTMARAEFIAKRPEIAKKVVAGEIKPAEAIRQIKKERIEKEVPVPTGKYRVIYADPPWSYGNTQAVQKVPKSPAFPPHKSPDTVPGSSVPGP